jgi:spermidine dehydrogenase
MKANDQVLGSNERICRRDFLDSALLASGAKLLTSLTPLQILAQQSGLTVGEWNGPNSGIGDYQNANGNTWEVINAGHKIRFGSYEELPSDVNDTGESFDCVVVGGGLAGLSAALTFKMRAGAKRNCLLLENHPIFGGEAKRNELTVDGHRIMGPQGSNLIWEPDPSSFLGQFLDRVGLDWKAAKYVPWGGPHPQMELSRTSYSWIYIMPHNFGFYFGSGSGKQPGTWVIDPWGKRLDGIPLSEEVRQDMLRWWDTIGKKEASPDWFGSPEEKGYRMEGDARSRYLDSITQEERLMQEYGVSRNMVRQFLSPIAATGYGLGCDVLSGFTNPGFYRLLTDKNQLSFPGGNAGIARHALKALIPDAIAGPATLETVCQNRVNFSTLDRPGNAVRMRLGCTVVRVEHERQAEKSDFVWVTYTRTEKLYRVKARSVVMASPTFVNRRIVHDLDSAHREAANHFYYAAHMTINIAVRNWQFLYKMGISGAHWFDGFGLWTEVRNPMVCGSDLKAFGPDSPTFLTMYVPFMYPGSPVGEQCTRGRSELISTPYRDIEHKVREQFTEMFSRSGFDPKRDIAGIILNRWGHAFIVAPPGFYFGKDGKPGPRDVFRNGPFGRISFGHSDVNGDPSAPGALEEGDRAARQIIQALS